MSIATRITSIEGHIEQAYDELQGLGADLTNVDKNIENISMVLDDIYDSMPQVSGEGTSLTLDDTRVGKIKSTLKGNTSQTGTPTPSSPIPVNVVSGDNSIEVCGKNLIDNSTNNNVWIFSDGSFTTSNGSNVIKRECSYGDTFTISATFESASSSGIILIAFYDENNNMLARYTAVNDTSLSLTKTAPQNTKYIYAGHYKANPTTIQLEKSSSASTYEPYQGNTYPINLGVKNLWNSEDMKSGYLPQSGSYPTTDPSYPNSRYIIVPLMKGQSITTYSEVTYSAFRIRYIDKDTNLIVGTVSVGENNGYCNSNATYQSGFANGTITATKDVLLGLWDFDGYMSTSGYYKITYGTTLQQISPNPIELAEISTYNNEIFRTSGKNLYDGLYTAKRYINYNTGEMRTSDDWSATDYIEIEPNTSYTLSGITNSGWTAGTSFYDNSKAFISSVYSTAYTFTTPTNAKYLRLSLNSETPINIMLNEGSTALPYEPYGTGEWYYKEAISQKILNGSENWGKSSKTQVNRYFVANVFVTILSASSIDLISNYFVCITPNQSDSNNIGLAKYNENGLMVNFSLTDTNFDTLEKFKTWLTSNNVLVRYVLATPTYNKITYEPLLEQLEAIYNAQGYDNQTNISQTNNDLPFIISASALKEWSE